jgi:IS30 family transposase
MAKQYNHLNQSMRDRIKALLDEGYGIRKIGRTVGLPHSTVGREVARNSSGVDSRTKQSKRGKYNPSSAQHKAYVRRKYSKYQGKKIQENNELRLFVIAKLREHLNPDEISGLIKANPALGFYASKTAIYEWLYSAWGQRYCEHLYSSRFKPKPRRKNKTKRVMIPDRNPIQERPEEALFRSEPGHCEFDSVVSSKRSGSTHALAVVQERSTRLVRAKLVPNLKPAGYARVIVELAKDLQVSSFTTDNGIENKHHKKITEHTGAPVFFTDPYSSWQKGGVENANKMLRRYFPKGTDFATVSQTDVESALTRINNKPRKVLGYESSLQVAKRKGVLVAGGALRG